MDIFVSVLLIGTVIGVIYFWIDFHIGSSVKISQEEWYLRFEKAFMPADLWMAACALAGAVGLLTGQTFGLIFSLLAAGSLVFLGLMDITFDIQNGLYRLITKSNQMKLEVASSWFFLLFGILLIIYLWPKIITG